MVKRLETKKKFQLAGGIFFCLLAIYFFIYGGMVNYNAKKIRENGIKVQAEIIKRGIQERFMAIPTLKYIYLVKFTVEGEERIGKAVSSELILTRDCVDIYCLPDSSKEVMDVVIESKKEYHSTGSNMIEYGIFFMIVSLGFFSYLKNR